MITRGPKYCSPLKESELFSGRIVTVCTAESRGERCLEGRPLKKAVVAVQVEAKRDVLCEGEWKAAGLTRVVGGSHWREGVGTVLEERGARTQAPAAPGTGEGALGRLV